MPLTGSRTYFAGPKFGFGDCVIWGSIRSLSVRFLLVPLFIIRTGNGSALGAIKKPGRPHLARWYNHVEALPIPKAALDSATEAKRDLEKGKKAKRTESVDVVLPNAVPGKVVLRFG